MGGVGVVSGSGSGRKNESQGLEIGGTCRVTEEAAKERKNVEQRVES